MMIYHEIWTNNIYGLAYLWSYFDELINDNNHVPREWWWWWWWFDKMMIYKSYKWCWAVHPSQQAKGNDPKAAVTMKIKEMKTTSWWRWWWWRWCWQCWRRWTTCIQAKGNDPCTKDCCCCGQLCTRTRLLSFTDFNAFFDFNHFQCGRSQTWEIFHRWQQNMSGTIFCSGTGTTFVSV